NTAGAEVGISAAPLRVDPTGTTTQPVSGTVTTTPPANASTNVTQFAGSPVAIGTGTGGPGVPRVTVSSDSVIGATQSGAWTMQPGNTPNTTPWLMTIQQGGNPATVNGSGALTVNCVTGCAASSAADTTGTGTLNALNAQAPAAPGLALAGTQGAAVE